MNIIIYYSNTFEKKDLKEFERYSMITNTGIYKKAICTNQMTLLELLFLQILSRVYHLFPTINHLPNMQN